MSILNRIGRTPLVRARNLEEALGVKKIYLKLEGNNPSGHRIDRLAILIIKEAISQKKDTICLGEHVSLAKSLAVLMEPFNLKGVFLFKNIEEINEIEELQAGNIEIIKCDENYLDECKKLSENNNWYDVNATLNNPMLNTIALSKIAKELTKKIKKPISNVYIQTRLGYGISGLHLGFKNLWVDEKIDKLPALHSCTCEYGNALYKEYFKSNFETLSSNVDGRSLKESKHNRNVYNSETDFITTALSAIYETRGNVKGISDEELERYVGQFNEIEDSINISIENGYPIAGFLKDVHEGKIKNGTHIIVLNDGKINISIQEAEEIDKNKVVNSIQEWLLEFKDSKEEIQNAVESAMKNGYILFAHQNEEVIGIAVVVNMGFESFIPTYHLGYIVAKNGEEGKGIATELLNRAIEVTDGNLSLHVEQSNERAIKVYEKMGFYQAYVRMIYRESEV